VADPRVYTFDRTGCRWASGNGGDLPPRSEWARLVTSAIGKSKKQWASAGRAAGRGIDQVRAEQVLWELSDAGVVAIHERQDRRGEWQPYEWRLTERGVTLAGEPLDPADIAAWLKVADPTNHPVLTNIRHWLQEGPDPSKMVTRLAMAVGATLRRGAVPQGRLISIEISGHTKSVVIGDYERQLEAVFGLPLDQVVRRHGRAVLAFGPFSFRIRGRTIDGSWSVPWIALTQETVRDMVIEDVQAKTLISFENLTALEEAVRQGLPPHSVGVFSGGFPSQLELDFMLAMCASGIEEAWHWGDLDLGGIRIFRHIAKKLPVPLTPWRMEPGLLDRLPTLPLTARDRKGLQAWVEERDAPLQELARELLERGVKAEQEGWFLAIPEG
jgi:hypothetical protein